MDGERKAVRGVSGGTPYQEEAQYAHSGTKQPIILN